MAGAAAPQAGMAGKDSTAMDAGKQGGMAGMEAKK
jgi:hypothetical protein